MSSLAPKVEFLVNGAFGAYVLHFRIDALSAPVAVLRVSILWINGAQRFVSANDSLETAVLDSIFEGLQPLQVRSFGVVYPLMILLD